VWTEREYRHRKLLNDVSIFELPTTRLSAAPLPFVQGTQANGLRYYDCRLGLQSSAVQSSKDRAEKKIPVTQDNRTIIRQIIEENIRAPDGGAVDPLVALRG
jgi:hypothetical protein